MSTEVAYTYDGATYCSGCIFDPVGEDVGVIHSWDEWYEAQEHHCQTLNCENCGTELDQYRYHDGMDAITRDALIASVKLAFKVKAILPVVLSTNADPDESLEALADKALQEADYTDLCDNVLWRGWCPVCT